MSRSGKVLVGIATYNEIENLPELVQEVFRCAPDVDVLVVDDNSPDGTGDWCDRYAAGDPRFTCLHRSAKLGLGTAALAIIQQAIQRGCRYLVNLDGDFSHDPAYLPAMIDRMEATDAAPLDVVIGSRYIPGGGVQGWPWHRRWMSRGVNAFARWTLRLRPRDCSGSFRCYRMAKLRELDLGQIRSRGYSFYEEILWHLHRKGARMVEVPIVFTDRQKGRSKINMKEAARALGVISLLGVRGVLPRAGMDSIDSRVGHFLL